MVHRLSLIFGHIFKEVNSISLKSLGQLWSNFMKASADREKVVWGFSGWLDWNYVCHSNIKVLLTYNGGNKCKKSSLLKSWGPQLTYMATSSCLKHKPCQPCPTGPNLPCPRVSWLPKTYTVGTLKKLFSEHMRPTAYIFSIYQCLVVFYTMHNKFSNCFVWVSPSTSDLELHLLSCRYKRRSSDKIFHLKKYRIIKRSSRAKVTFNLKTSG